MCVCVRVSVVSVWVFPVIEVVTSHPGEYIFTRETSFPTDICRVLQIVAVCARSCAFVRAVAVHLPECGLRNSD